MDYRLNVPNVSENLLEFRLLILFIHIPDSERMAALMLIPTIFKESQELFFTFYEVCYIIYNLLYVYIAQNINDVGFNHSVR